MGNRAATDIGRLRFVGTGKQSLRDAHQICVLHLNMATEASLPPKCSATFLVRTPVARCHGTYWGKALPWENEAATRWPLWSRLRQETGGTASTHVLRPRFRCCPRGRW